MAGDLHCARTGVHAWCCDTDVKLVQLRSQTAGNQGSNLYEGPVVPMCRECRKSNQGGFKIIKKDCKQ